MDVACRAESVGYVPGSPLMAREEPPGAAGGEIASPLTEQVLACSHEDMTRLAQILRGLPYVVVLRGANGTVLLPADHDAGNPARLNGVRVLSAPIHDSRAELLVYLELIAIESAPAGASKRLLQTLIDSAARAITERLFRIFHRRDWIFAAERSDKSGIRILMAVDTRQRIVGADRNARQLLEQDAHAVPDLSLSAFFQIDATWIRGQRYRDFALQLQRPDDRHRWSVLVTPPDPKSRESHIGERELLHARPRLDAITLRLENKPWEQPPRRGLPLRMLQRVQEYIDTHLESTLTTDELAAHLRVSISQFGRAFAKSVGMTPHNYVMRRRLARAQQLLEETDLPLVEIALRTGFSDQSHFCRRFQRLNGLAPGAFRAQRRELSSQPVSAPA